MDRNYSLWCKDLYLKLCRRHCNGVSSGQLVGRTRFLLLQTCCMLQALVSRHPTSSKCNHISTYIYTRTGADNSAAFRCPMNRHIDLTAPSDHANATSSKSQTTKKHQRDMVDIPGSISKRFATGSGLLKIAAAPKHLQWGVICGSSASSSSLSEVNNA